MKLARTHSIRRTWAWVAVSAVTVTMAIAPPASAAPGDLGSGSGAIVAPSSNLALIRAGLTDDAVYGESLAGIVAAPRGVAGASWSPVLVDGSPLVGRLLQSDSEVLLVADDDAAADSVVWKDELGVWHARSVPSGSVLGRGGRYVLLPAQPAGTARVTWRIEDVRTASSWSYEAPADRGVSIDGGTLWALEVAPASVVEIDLASHAVVSRRGVPTGYTFYAPRGRWTLTGSATLPFILDVPGIYSSFGLRWEFDADTVDLGRDVAVGIGRDTDSPTLTVVELAGEQRVTRYGPAMNARPDLDDAAQSVAYVGSDGRVRLVDLRGAPVAATTNGETAPPSQPYLALEQGSVTSGTTVTARSSGVYDYTTGSFRASGGAVIEMTYRQAPFGRPFGAWAASRPTTTLTARAADGVTTCFTARAHDANGNYTSWSESVCSRTDTSAPRFTKVSAPSVVRVVKGKAVGTLTYAADDPSGVLSYDVRYRVKAKGAAAYGAWVYRTAFQGTTSTTTAVSISDGQRLCLAVRARDGLEHVSAWSTERCMGTDAAAPRITRTAAPRWLPVPSSGKAKITFTYAGTDDRGVTSYDVQVRVAPVDGPRGLRTTVAARTTKTSVTRTLRAGEEACFRVRARDAVGNVSSWSKERCTSVAAGPTSKPMDADKVSTVGGVKVVALKNGVRHGSGGYWSANVFHSGSTGIRLQVRTCPACGTFNVQVGEKVMAVKTTSSRTGWKTVTLRWKNSGEGEFVFFDEVTPYPRERVTTSYVRSWVLLHD
ncbi:fibronectin type III domain-containing protein [Cellulomonas rhizosphaerae]|uniref:Fibronectin type-III domain-containing protein n=1 Tax=Cellulomonas rhizosphaerae TaxID=2293719 RepID=A0A413RI30_9CELL|nr:hypothetical protein [Cellulomonas rhizosphaerae]RHA37904.1 hypothetical protein D1825_15900 [Cellulomonas rhizosphaerae]